MKTAFKTKSMKSESFGVITKNAHKRNTAHNNKELIKLGFSATVATVSQCI